MLTALVAILFSTPPDCTDQRSYRWPSSSFPVVVEGAVRVRALVWVPASADAFVMELPEGGQVLIGQPEGTAAIKNVSGWKVDGAVILLPALQNKVVVTQWGFGLGCRVTSKGGDLGGPIPGSVKLDVRKKWRFEVRDRSMKEVFLSF